MNLEPSTFGDPSFYPNPRRHLTEYYYSSGDYYAVPIGALYSRYEKLQFPFDETTWKMIFIVFVIAFVTIFVVNLMTVKIRNIVIGENVNTPSLNIAVNFFGLGQIVLPRRNFARFLVMVFILYCLIIRTAWQSKMFEFMQKEMRKSEVKSMEEARGKLENFYTESGNWLKDGTRIHYKKGTDYYDKMVEIISDPSFDGIILLDSRYWPDLLRRMKSAEIFKRVLKFEDTYVAPSRLGLPFPLNHKFYERFNEVIRTLNEAGVIQRLVAKYYELCDPKIYEKPIQFVDENGRKRLHKEYLETTWHKSNIADSEPKVLTMNDLEFGFVI
jgi:hypothetical protein